MKNKNVLHFNIAIIGQKRIGKNYFAEILSKVIENKGMPSLNEISIASSIKYQSIFPQGYENDYFNYNYLYEDIMKLYSYDTLYAILNSVDYDFSSLINDINNGSLTPEKLREDYSEEFILQLIELFKIEEPFLSTRRHLQEFGDYLKEKSNNPFVLSETLIREIKLKDFYHDICTDTRFITELIDFILNDFYIIQLKNKEMSITDSIELLKQHISELELGLYGGEIGHVFDLETNEGFFIQGAHRLSQEQMTHLIELNLGKILSFQGYKQETKIAIKELKKKIISDFNNENEGLLLAQKQFNEFQKELFSDTRNLTDHYEEGMYLLERYLTYRNDIVSYIYELISPYYQ